MTVIKLINIFNATALLAGLLKVFNKKGSLNSAPPKPIKPPKIPIGAPIRNAKSGVFLLSILKPLNVFIYHITTPPKYK